MKRRMRIALALILAMVLAACGTAAEPDDGDDGADTTAASGDDGGSEGDGELMEITAAPTVPGPLYWPFYWSADPLGFYEEEGLSVEIVPVDAGVPQALLSGVLDIGGVGSDFYPQGAEIEDLSWVMMTDAYLFQAVVPGDSELETIADLAGGQVGINEPQDEFDAEFVLVSNGIERGDYDLVPLGEAVAGAEALVSGDVPAFITPVGSSWVEMNDAFPDADFRILDSPGTEGMYNTGLITTDANIADNPEMVTSFCRAIAKGMIWMYENPEVTAEAVLEMEPEAAEDIDQALRFVNRAAEVSRGIYESRGEIDVDTVQRTIDLTAELGFIEEAYPAERVVDTSLYDQCWDFDVDAEIEAARAAEVGG